MSTWYMKRPFKVSMISDQTKVHLEHLMFDQIAGLCSFYFGPVIGFRNENVYLWFPEWLSGSCFPYTQDLIQQEFSLAY